MSRCHQVARPMARCLRYAPSIRSTPVRPLSSTSSQRDVKPTTSSSSSIDAAAADALASSGLARVNPDTPNTALDISKIEHIPGTRRRRLAVQQTPDIPFEQTPYHCFQEARKILKEDRDEKLELIKQAYERIKRVEAQPVTTYRGGEHHKIRVLSSLRRHLESLKIEADINDPLVKRKFEDGLADFSKPIYRYLARQKWKSMAYKILVQRVKQFHITPDVLPTFDPKIDVQLTFRGVKVQPGEKVDSLVTESPPNLRLQVFDPNEHLISVVVMDSDVPDPGNDAFDSRLHFIASNIPISCLTKNVSLNLISKQKHLAVPWLPPTAQEGAPYHRLSIWVLEHRQNKPLDINALREAWQANRDGFKLTDFMAKYDVKPIGFNMFRSEWDVHTRDIMGRHRIPGSNIVFRRKRVYSLKTPKKPRGWEAKRQGPKYRQLWKYTKRIAKSPGGT